MKTITERNKSLDIAKGIAIFLVVWGHVIQQNSAVSAECNYLFRAIYSVHMPLFAMISGYFFYFSCQKKSLAEVLLTKGKGYVKLLLIWNSVHFMLDIVLNGREPFTVTLICRQWMNEILSGYWFLWAMLLYSLLSACVLKKMKERYWGIGFLLVMFALLISPCRWVIITLFPFFIAGIYGARMNGLMKIKAANRLMLLFPIYIIGLLIYLSIDYIGNSQIKVVIDRFRQLVSGNANVCELSSEFGRLGLYYLMGFVGSICILVISSRIAKVGKGVWSNAFVACGKMSLAIYILQRIFVEQLFPRVGIRDICVNVGTIGENVLLLVLACLFMVTLCGIIRGLKRIPVGEWLINNR